MLQLAPFSPTSNLGDLRTVNLKIDKYLRPKILLSRKIPLALQSKVKQEFNSLVKRNTISLVNELTSG